MRHFYLRSELYLASNKMGAEQSQLDELEGEIRQALEIIKRMKAKAEAKAGAKAKAKARDPLRGKAKARDPLRGKAKARDPALRKVRSRGRQQEIVEEVCKNPSNMRMMTKLPDETLRWIYPFAKYAARNGNEFGLRFVEMYEGLMA